MRVTPDGVLPEVRLVEPTPFRDARGTFVELFNAERYAAHGLPLRLRQDSLSISGPRVLRGLHFQHPRGQGKLVTVAEGAVFDVAVDVRRGSPTFGRWTGYTLTAERLHQLWIPPGFAHGFVVLGERAIVTYKCTEVYDAAGDCAVRWDDPAIGITWPVADPLLSAKDAAAPRLADVPPERLPAYEGAGPAAPG